MIEGGGVKSLNYSSTQTCIVRKLIVAMFDCIYNIFYFQGKFLSPITALKN